MKKFKINANAVITNSEGKFLLIDLKVGPFKGSLCIPGGGIEPGELSHETVRREVHEETGITITPDSTPFGFCELMHDEINRHSIVLLHHAAAEGTPVETEEGIGKWMTYEEAEPRLITFAKESIRIWKEQEKHFTLVNDPGDSELFKQQRNIQD